MHLQAQSIKRLIFELHQLHLIKYGKIKLKISLKKYRFWQFKAQNLDGKAIVTFRDSFYLKKKTFFLLFACPSQW